MKFPAVTLQNSGVMIDCGASSNSRCLLGVNYPPARHCDGTHTPVEYALHLWFIPSHVATHETSQRRLGALGNRML